MVKKAKVGVLFVCLGNICRSPSSEGVFRQRVEQAELGSFIDIDSAGTAAYHIGDPPDPRAIVAAAKRGVELQDLRARQVHISDYDRFDYIIAMDRYNYNDLMSLAPPEHDSHICLFLDFAEQHTDTEIPDPYYGGGDGFEHVLDMIDDASDGLIKDIKRNHLNN